MQLLSKTVSVLTIFLMLLYGIGPVHELLFPQHASCCCSDNCASTDCACKNCVASCTSNNQSEPKQPISTVNTTTINPGIRIEHLPAKLYNIPTIAQLLQVAKPAVFAGHNETEMSTTITRLQTPLRV